MLKEENIMSDPGCFIRIANPGGVDPDPALRKI